MEQKVFKAAVVVKDEHGLPNHMTMFYMEPGTYEPEDVPEMFKVAGKVVPAILISQYANTMLNSVPVSLPYQKPAANIDYNEAAAACRKKGKGWHLLTNTEFVYLMEEAKELGHTIGGNTDRGQNWDKQEEKGVTYDGYRTLTGCDPLSWSHDGTKDGVFGLCGNFWEWVLGLRLHKGVIEYIPENDAAAEDFAFEAPEWTAAKVNDKELKLEGRNGGVVLTDGSIDGSWGGCHYSELQFAGSLEEVPEIAYRLGIAPRNYKEEKACIWADADLKEAVPCRGSSFNNTSSAGVARLYLINPRTYSSSSISLRSALYLEDWKLAADLLMVAR